MRSRFRSHAKRSNQGRPADFLADGFWAVEPSRAPGIGIQALTATIYPAKEAQKADVDPNNWPRRPKNPLLRKRTARKSRFQSTIEHRPGIPNDRAGAAKPVLCRSRRIADWVDIPLWAENQWSKCADTSLSSLTIGRCCGQASSHWPHSTQSFALPNFFASAS